MYMKKGVVVPERHVFYFFIASIHGINPGNTVLFIQLYFWEHTPHSIVNVSYDIRYWVGRGFIEFGIIKHHYIRTLILHVQVQLGSLRTDE